MTNRHDLLLQAMGITRWQLVRPQILQGVVGIHLSEQTRLIVVADEDISNTPLLQDILLSLELSKDECLCLNFEQTQHLDSQQLGQMPPLKYWLIGDEPQGEKGDENQSKIHRTLALCQNAEQIYRTPNWQAFRQDPQLKRQLWQQIQAKK